MFKLTWMCHICGADREDEKISVCTTDTSEDVGLPSGTLTQNVRYCNDNENCRDMAPYYRFYTPGKDG